MEFSYKRDMNHTYMICRGDQPVDTSAYPVRMMLSNQWKAFLPCRIQGMDNQVFFYYDITSRQSLSSFFGGGKLDYRQLRSLVESLLAALEEAEEYLLDSRCILLEPAYIFWDSLEEAFFFCYVPGEPPEGRGNIQELTEYLLPRIDHRDQEAVVLGYGVYRKAMEENFYGGQLRELLYQSSEGKDTGGQEPEENFPEALESEDRLAWWTEDEEERERKWGFPGSARVKIIAETAGILLLGFLLLLAGSWAGFPPLVNLAAAVGTLAAAAIRLVLGLRKKEGKEETFSARPLPLEAVPGTEERGQGKYPKQEIKEGREQGKHPEQKEEEKRRPPESPTGEALSGETGNPGGGEKATTLLYQENGTAPRETFCLVPQGRPGLEPLFLEGEILLVGKIKGTAHLIIDLPTVSRLHARLEKRGEVYYLQDLNSKNGTRINKKELVGEEQAALQPGDRVAFADAVYFFQRGPGGEP